MYLVNKTWSDILEIPMERNGDLNKTTKISTPAAQIPSHVALFYAVPECLKSNKPEN